MYIQNVHWCHFHLKLNWENYETRMKLTRLGHESVFNVIQCRFFSPVHISYLLQLRTLTGVLVINNTDGAFYSSVKHFQMIYMFDQPIWLNHLKIYKYILILTLRPLENNSLSVWILWICFLNIFNILKDTRCTERFSIIDTHISSVLPLNTDLTSNLPT